MAACPKVLGIIPARYASSRFPAKMLAPILGKTLIQRTYENSCQCPLFDEIIIATDNALIFDHAKSFGAHVVMTSPDCPTGSDRLAEVLRRNPHLQKASIVVGIQGDEPCLSPAAFKGVGEILLSDNSAAMSTAVAPLAAEEAALPSVVKCVLDLHQNALYFSRALIPAGHGLKHRPGVVYYRHIGIYGFRTEFLMRYGELAPTPLQLAEDLEQLKVLEHGYKIKAAIIEECFDIGVNVPEDIQKVEQWLCKQNSSSSPAAFARL